MKMIIYSLGFFGILVVLLASGCSIYYPTSYRAFIPKQWDSEYKEYERLCKENIGKVVYARPAPKDFTEDDIFFSSSTISINNFIAVRLYSTIIYNNYIYIYIYILGALSIIQVGQEEELVLWVVAKYIFLVLVLKDKLTIWNKRL
ncbi:hypothetical protein CQA53_10685 [Helicobacter didelphidarum]|uniref:Lipoprotein n=1 Tax=Helicobacter didelphidarum TaxID=2040648 RepID=A0A3D8I772_9HELI|nr:hypothetical protein [Helicobacter didelphidarum]RDU60846.1 hypothetical protein CQA53_10685 [Helicobacter didelphidarum]